MISSGAPAPPPPKGPQPQRHGPCISHPILDPCCLPPHWPDSASTCSRERQSSTDHVFGCKSQRGVAAISSMRFLYLSRVLSSPFHSIPSTLYREPVFQKSQVPFQHHTNTFLPNSQLQLQSSLSKMGPCGDCKCCSGASCSGECKCTSCGVRLGLSSSSHRPISLI
jgi:hypothetical protein